MRCSTTARLVSGAGLGAMILMGMHLLTWDAHRPLTLSELSSRQKRRSDYWRCVKNSEARLRPLCRSLPSVLKDRSSDPLNVAMEVLALPLLLLLALVSLFGSLAGLVLGWAVARGHRKTILFLSMSNAASAACSLILMKLGILAETFTTLAMVQIICFVLLVSLRLGKKPAEPALSLRKSHG